MDLETLDWHDELLAAFGIPRSMLPEIRSSSGHFGTITKQSLLREVPVTGILGDQQAATFGQVAFEAGEAKNTYGTGNFLIVNTGEQIVHSEHGLITTVAYRLGDDAPRYALEGSIAVTGSLIQWLRDNLGLIKDASEAETIARTVDDNGGVFVVPAFSGLFAPYWRPDARGAILGLTRFVTSAHIVRASLESTAFQTREVMDAAAADSGVHLTELRVDGGMVANDLLMQFQADILGMPVVRPRVAETTALGAAYAAGLAVGFWSGLDELRSNWQESKRWEPTMDDVGARHPARPLAEGGHPHLRLGRLTGAVVRRSQPADEFVVDVVDRGEVHLVRAHRAPRQQTVGGRLALQLDAQLHALRARRLDERELQLAPQ